MSEKAKLTSLTFEGTGASALYDMTVSIPRNSNLVLTWARVDLNIFDPALVPKSISIRIDGTISNKYVVDSNPQGNYLKLAMQHNPVVIDGDPFNITEYAPMIGYYTTSSIERQAQIIIRDASGNELLAGELEYFFLQFQVL